MILDVPGARRQSWLWGTNECEKGQEEKEKTPSNLMSLEQNLSEKPPLDGGYSWIACLVGFFVMFVIGGQLNIAGIIFAALLDEYNTNRGQTGKTKIIFPSFVYFYLPLFLISSAEPLRGYPFPGFQIMGTSARAKRARERAVFFSFARRHFAASSRAPEPVTYIS